MEIPGYRYITTRYHRSDKSDSFKQKYSFSKDHQQFKKLAKFDKDSIIAFLDYYTLADYAGTAFGVYFRGREVAAYKIHRPAQIHLRRSASTHSLEALYCPWQFYTYNQAGLQLFQALDLADAVPDGLPSTCFIPKLLSLKTKHVCTHHFSSIRLMP